MSHRLAAHAKALPRCQSQTMEMQLVSLSTDIRTSQKLSVETGNNLYQKLTDVEHRMALMSERQKRGAQELAVFLAGCRSVLRSAPQFVVRLHFNGD